MEIKAGKCYQGVVEKAVYGGKGMVKLHNFVVLVERATLGQEIEFQVTKLQKNYAEGKLTKILQKASFEIAPQCRHFGKCGGCKWQNLPYEVQLQIKSAQIQESLNQFYKGKDYQFEQIISSSNQWHYRNKVEFSFGYEKMETEINAEGKRIYHDLNPSLGFHLPGKFELIVPIQKCWLASAEMNQILEILQKFQKEQKLSVHNPKTHRGFLRGVTVRQGTRTGEILVTVVVNGNSDQGRKGEGLWNKLIADLRKIKGIVGILLTFNRALNDAVIDGETQILWGQDFLYDQIGALSFKISPGSFFQTNTLTAEKLYDTAREFADLKGHETVLDLYCGTGTIGLFLAEKAQKIYGIELLAAAIENARENAQLNQISNAEFICGNIDCNLETLWQELGGKIDVIILDPPRPGVGPKALQQVIKMQAQKIVYVSCNPTTFARDVEILSQNGYTLKRVRPVDMFPQTHHIEIVGEIVKKTS